MRRLPFLLLITLFMAALSLGSASAGTDIVLTVNADDLRGTISPHVYGLNFARDAFADEIDLTFKRWGGNSRERYNYQLNAHNTAEDWFFHNVGTYLPYDFSDESADDWVARNLALGTESGISLPLVGYVAKDATSCSYPRSVYPNQRSFTNDCGDGHAPDGTPLGGTDVTRTSIVADADYVTDWVNHLKATHGDDAVNYYYLGNEPSLWSVTHYDVHPEHQTYAELRDQSIAFAAAVKAADANAQLLGPTSFNYSGYFNSRADTMAAASNGYTAWPDLDATGLFQVPYFLEQMRAYEQANGTRLLDYLDVHYYPNFVSLAPAGDANFQAQRFRNTRGLWDPTYRDEGWIGSDDQTEDFRYVRLIPRLKAWIDAHYPGTKLSIGEYDFGGGEHINGALTQIDVLGIFGREGVDIATHWNYPGDNTFLNYDTLPIGYAFRMYRNYDGNGGKFGDMSVAASSSDEGQMSVYAAKRDDGALTVMVVNKAMAPVSAEINLSGSNLADTAETFRYSSDNLTSIVQLSDQQLGGSATINFPADSATLYVVQSSTPTAVSIAQTTTSDNSSTPIVAGLVAGLGAYFAYRRIRN